MSQNYQVDAGAESSKTPGLKPVLAAALASLEVQLDQELARYRRARFAARNMPNQPRVRIPMNGKTQQIIMNGVKAHSPVAEDNQEISLPQLLNTIPPPSSDSQTEPELSQTVKHNVSQLHQTPSTPAVDQKIPSSTPNSASIVPAATREQSDDIVRPNQSPKPPDDYLESSEALLRSLAQEEAETSKPSNSSSEKLISPLSIGAMLLLLMSSLTLGYLVFNLKNWPQLRLDGLFARNHSNSQTKTEATNNNTQTGTPTSLAPIPKYPNLASGEFPEVKDPNDVVGLTPKPKVTTISIPSPVLTPDSVLPLPAVVTPTPVPLQPPVVSQTPLATPTVTPSPQPVATAQKLDTDDAEMKPSADGLYHVITDNQGENAFAKARQIVPDAYLSPSKQLIYLGALKTKEQVQQQLQMLEANGIKARVQEP